jgi:hypothetical protein
MKSCWKGGREKSALGRDLHYRVWGLQQRDEFLLTSPLGDGGVRGWGGVLGFGV